jgi:hypothetical protein
MSSIGRDALTIEQMQLNIEVAQRTAPLSIKHEGFHGNKDSQDGSSPDDSRACEVILSALKPEYPQRLP